MANKRHIALTFKIIFLIIIVLMSSAALLKSEWVAAGIAVQPVFNESQDETVDVSTTPDAVSIASPEPIKTGQSFSVYQDQIDSYVSDTIKNSRKEYYRQKWAYITFDDGPSRNNTNRNLDTLKKYGIKATFFVLPHEGIDEVYQRILDEGHVIGNHSYSHDFKILYHEGMAAFRSDVLAEQDYIFQKFHYTTRLFRFPGGTGGKKIGILSERSQFLAMSGYNYFDWDATVADTDLNLALNRTEDEIVQKLIHNVIDYTGGRKQLIVLMHDDASRIYTSRALPEIIEGLIKKGYKFDVLSNYYQ